jgi:ribosomal protein S18 acetylase RimI-like enzyme
MKLLRRQLQDESDYWRMRDLLRQVFLLTGRQRLSWHVARLDYWWVRRHDFLPDTPVEEVVFTWQTPEGKLVAALLPEHPGIAFHHVHPEYRTRKLEEEILTIAEKHLAVAKDGDRHNLYVVAHQHDQLRREILARRGFQKFDHPKATEHQRRRSLDQQIPRAPLAPGYTVRSLREDEIPARGLAAWQTTRSDEPDNDFHGWEWLLSVYTAPLYRRDLDIVAVAPDGAIASFCTLWFDDVTRSGFFEPVGTAREHQRRGLARACMSEALRRLARLGATKAYVSSYTSPAHELYASLGFSDYDLSEPWVKEV